MSKKETKKETKKELIKKKPKKREKMAAIYKSKKPNNFDSYNKLKKEQEKNE